MTHVRTSTQKMRLGRGSKPRWRGDTRFFLWSLEDSSKTLKQCQQDSRALRCFHQHSTTWVVESGLTSGRWGSGAEFFFCILGRTSAYFARCPWIKSKICDSSRLMKKSCCYSQQNQLFSYTTTQCQDFVWKKMSVIVQPQNAFSFIHLSPPLWWHQIPVCLIEREE